MNVLDTAVNRLRKANDQLIADLAKYKNLEQALIRFFDQAKKNGGITMQELVRLKEALDQNGSV